MKSLTFIFSTFFLYSASVAQGNIYYQLPDNPPSKLEVKQEQRFQLGDLKGPRAKNYPTHAYRSSEVKTTAPTEASAKRLGPAAKNYKPWQNEASVERVTVTKKKRENLKGPRAKNRKPWDNR